MPAGHTGGEFLGLPPEACDRARSPVIVLPVPYEATTTYAKGTERGPAAILAASTQVEFYDEIEGDEPCMRGIHTLPPFDCSGTPDEVLGRLRTEVAGISDEGKFVIALGGEHTLTVGAVRGAARGPALTVVHVDAHADLRDEYEGSPLNHACVMRRLAPDFPIVQVGVRAFSSEEAEFARASGIVQVTAAEIAKARGIAREAAEEAPWVRRALGAIRGREVYLTVDLDGLDPAVVPNVGTPDPGGLSWYEMLALLKQLFLRKKVVAADVVELCPAEGSVLSDYAAARLAYKIAGHAIRSADRARRA